MQTIAVIGGGLVGRLITAVLADKNVDSDLTISLFEKGQLSSVDTTGRLAAAMVSPTAESVVASDHIVEMGKQSTMLWPDLLQILGCPECYHQNGTVVVAHRQDMNELHHFKQRTRPPAKSSIQSLTRHELEALEPELAKPFSHGLFLENEGHIDNHQLFEFVETKIKNAQVNVFENCQVELSERGVCVAGVEQKFDWVIDCRGLGAKSQILANAKVLRGVRGEVARVKAPEVKLTRPIRLMHPRYPIYIAPKPDHEYVIGATEIESQDTKKPTVRSTMELLSAAYSVHSGFAEAEVLTIQSGLRPTLIDNEPRVFKDKNIIQINGLYRHGYMISPYIVAQVLALLEACSDLKHLSFTNRPIPYDSLLIQEVSH